MLHPEKIMNAPHAIGTDDARGGVTGHNVRYVLAGGLILIIAAFMSIPLFY
jgi:hypothetical protein